MAQLLKTNTKVLNVKPMEGDFFTLEELQKAVGGYIEIVDLNNGYALIINEEGKLNSLPYNEVATSIFRMHVHTDDFIVGNAILCKNDEIK